MVEAEVASRILATCHVPSSTFCIPKAKRVIRPVARPVAAPRPYKACTRTNNSSVDPWLTTKRSGVSALWQGVRRCDRGQHDKKSTRSAQKRFGKVR
eukprot:6178652-Pleurochrysis_carterae.AAC.4